ncbi:sigma-54 interaction domain-containing protein [Clostridium folliculivorans]|uniref:Fis family transcriptional regulator n=1 Tax=Clostridium folliculivorans TaxID=2886038 RepID=A0A9W5Y4U5_9CLOT|nr:sigma 54-interacting transcriptional regulator [Clostridium folliculivorans]GKU26614.1 hypothetical protein CFOLD11_34410 [Clostridium folliculivorans]GKU28954.1 hypothetical protein CFB3_10600 [Clostridium folliculivorans]
MKIDELQKNILDSLHDGVLIADKNCTIIYINPSYTRITGVNPDIIIGQPLHTVREGSKLPEVINSGQKLIGIPRKVDDKEYVVNMVPIIENNEIVGGISIVNEINDVYTLIRRLTKSNKIIGNLRKRVTQLHNTKYTIDDIIGIDYKSQNTKNLALKIAKKDSNVLITGESGTGKELFAQSIHNASSRSDRAFVAINCAALDNNLLESELFGYEEGAFTGAIKGGKPGLFREADGGTIFLDEISEMDYRLQAKLLRAIQEKVIRPVGGLLETTVDVRIIAATNKSLETMILENKFRQDLYFRIAVFTIDLCPLRERRDDIIPLVQNYLSEAQPTLGKEVILSNDVIEVLYNYDWPGNVRELKNTIEYALMMSDNSIITSDTLPKRILDSGLKKESIEIKTLDRIVKDAEANEIKKAISQYGNTVEGKKKVAKALGISLASLYNKLNTAK